MGQNIQTLKFQKLPSPTTGDHETRILVDGADILSLFDDALGLDPPDFFEQGSLQDGGRALIGRCNCGVIGCGD